MISQSSMGASSKGESSWVQRSSKAYSVPLTRVTRTRTPPTSASRCREALRSVAEPMSVHSDMVVAISPSEHAGLQPGRLGHHRLIPRRIEHQLDVGDRDGRNDFQLLFDVLHQHVTHPASRCGQRESYIEGPLAVRLHAHGTFVDET